MPYTVCSKSDNIESGIDLPILFLILDYFLFFRSYSIEYDRRVPNPLDLNINRWLKVYAHPLC